MKRVAIHQPHYCPWRPYLEKWRAADVFIVLDTVQYERGGWQNRCQIPDGRWLSVPVHAPLPTLIKDVTIYDHPSWRRKHAWAVPEWKDLYAMPWERLADLALETMDRLAAKYEVTTPRVLASSLGVDADDASERLIALVKAVGGDTYLAGQVAEYLDVPAFARAGLGFEVRDFITGQPTWTAAL